MCEPQHNNQRFHLLTKQEGPEYHTVVIITFLLSVWK